MSAKSVVTDWLPNRIKTRLWPVGRAAIATAALTLASGCATQLSGPSASLPGDETLAADAPSSLAELLPQRPLNTIDTHSGMHSRSSEAVLQAVAQLGTPYRWGGESAQQGFDCSGLTQHVYRKADLHLPRSSSQQYQATDRIERDELRPGDLVFFRLKGSRIDHVGIYAGDDRFIHAPSKGKTVSFASLKNRYWARRYAGAGRTAEANKLQLASNRSEEN
ncbi:MAG: C40 family peptidase [Halothiobacillaceae bacterium]